MDTKWKVFPVFLSIIFIELSYGFPINLENGGTDSHTQLLTGLVAVLLTVCCIVALAGCLCCTRNDGFKEFRDSPVVVSVASDLDHGHVNPIANGEFTIFTPLSPPHYNNNIFLANEELLTRAEDDYKYDDIDVRSWFDQNEKEFPRTKLKYIRELGKGWFGRVVEGTAQDVDDVQIWTPVVVRILEANSSNKDRVLFLNDANIYHFGAHLNILPLLGRSLDTVPMLLMQEYCPKGDLKKNLIEYQNEPEAFLSSELPLRWCCQLSLAIQYLHNKNIAHLDLAARNCLITNDLHLKIGDYGLSTSHYPDDYYLASPGLPIRWCSPESVNYTSTTIQPNKITLEANIWSLGITMWEIFECGKQPYSNFNDDEVITQVLGPPNVRLPRPTNTILYTDYMYRLMQMCWSSFELRPKISQIEMMLEDLMEVYKNMKHDKDGIFDFDQRWKNLKPNNIVKTDNHVLEDNLNNLEQSKEIKGSLNNLLDEKANQNSDMESWLKDLATNTDDLSYVRGLHDAMNDLDNVIALENVSSSESSHRPSPAPLKNKIEFKLGPIKKSSKLSLLNTENDSFVDSLQYVTRTSSESETEEENWKKKIEKGVYSEKVRQKSRSVTDLMVLTHIDCSESESETPLQSLDYRVNHKNVRLTQNLENASLMFGSEGNLLNVKETFQEELRKLREERKDSLLFVPVTNNETDCLPRSSSKTELNIVTGVVPQLESQSNTNLMQDLNNPSDIRPTNQIYNIYNVSVQSNYNPVQNNNIKLNEINYHDLVNENTPDVQMNEKDLQLSEILPDIIYDIHLNLHINSPDVNGDVIEDMQPECKKVFEEKLHECAENVKLIEEDAKCDENIQKELNSLENTQLLKNQILVETLNVDLKIDKVVDNNNSNKIEFEDVKISLEDITNNPNIILAGNSIKEEVVTKENIENVSTCIKSLLDKENNLCDEEDKIDNAISNSSQIQEDEINCIAELEFFSAIRDPKTEQLSQTFDTKSDNNESDTENTDFQTEINLKDNLCDSILSNTSELGSDSLHFNIESEELSVSPIQNNKESIMLKNSTPNSKSMLQNGVIFGSCTDYTIDLYSGLKTSTNEAEELQFSSNFNPENCDLSKEENANECMNYSLDSWDNFLDKALDKQEFDFNSEPQSMNFLPAPNENDEESNKVNETTITVKNDENNLNETYVLNASDTFILEDCSNDSEQWESGEGWFLHEQTMPEELTGEMNIVQESTSDSYVGFSMDDDVMSAIRNELLMKLPQAQRVSNERMLEQDVETDSGDRVEIFIKFNTPLSPIPEESYSECNSCQYTPQREDSDDESDWTEPALQSNVEDIPVDTETPSPHVLESPIKGPHHRHTPSQDSCCSNDTLFNLEELVANEQDKMLKETADVSEELESQMKDISHDDSTNIELEETYIITEPTIKNENIIYVTDCESSDKENTIDNSNKEHNDQNEIKYKYLNDFIINERSNITSDNKYISTTFFLKKNNAPLPSPEDRQWKEIHAPFLTYNGNREKSELIDGKLELINDKSELIECKSELIDDKSELIDYKFESIDDKSEIVHDEIELSDDKSKLGDQKSELINKEKLDTNDYVNVNSDYENPETAIYVNNGIPTNNEYVNCVNPIYENDINSPEYMNVDNKDDVIEPEYVDHVNSFEHVEDHLDDIYEPFTDIRFSGPCDNQLMSTSFSESNDLGDEQDWDSGSDTRSSSSGEFLWKHDEHEESVKALRVAPQDIHMDDFDMEKNEENGSESTGSEEEGDGPEFVPSAWDKYAIPTKSALRSPEKTLEKPDKKSKGVWFKKQKYHCVYEYPKEPESPILQSCDLWKPSINFPALDWNLEDDTFQSKSNDLQTCEIQNGLISEMIDNVHSTSLGGDFFISSSTRPFDNASSLGSEFFPGKCDNWTDFIKINDNITPDSGIDDLTPASITDISDLQTRINTLKEVQPLKNLAAYALNKTNNQNKVLGGLRHTRNKLKLDLPPSPTAFSSTKIFMVEPQEDLVVRSVPTFTTFGKTRFQVQHVDTPNDDEKSENYKNVSFEALPHKPLKTQIFKEDISISKDKQNVEMVRGEASLLDSADEDSGIESCTLERKKVENNIVE